MQTSMVVDRAEQAAAIEEAHQAAESLLREVTPNEQRRTRDENGVYSGYFGVNGTSIDVFQDSTGHVKSIRVRYPSPEGHSSLSKAPESQEIVDHYMGVNGRERGYYVENAVDVRMDGQSQDGIAPVLVGKKHQKMPTELPIPLERQSRAVARNLRNARALVELSRSLAEQRKR